MKLPLMMAALLVSPVVLAAGTGPTYPDDPHNPAPKPGVESTLDPIEKPMPRDTDPRLPGDDQRLPGSDQRQPETLDNQNLPGMNGSGTPGTPTTKP